ncbi:recombinase family protein [Profundibacterium mesophilum]|uniref:DNA-invertase from lambdoid prophage e14 n=1 Tax=Profundibacterium mesophilum KAUST100406-0324 TaxID=1037889 RepID=A0A921NVS2_9RHOB|nr:recombinase family protein [Profundibacterium mesophilum]KAF0674468.1 DNA-invertase from lambdoid prophage e14 [Profundibacterium mesophilum KAUST100406-0324]
MKNSGNKVTSKSENPPGRKIGYARVSTADQNPDMQIAALKAYGVSEDLIFVDRASGGTMNRPMFIRALKTAQHPGTEFVVWKLDRMGRTLEGIIEVLNLLESRDVKFFSLTERVDMTTPMGKAMLQMMAVVAELERNLIVERTKAGIARARERGEKGGRPVAMTPARVEVADTMLRLGSRGNEVWQALKPLSEVPISRAAYFAWQKLWDAGEVTDLPDEEV